MHADDDTALPIGEHVDAYEIVDRLGRGGFGITYKVFDQGLNSHFALKEFFPADLVARDGSALRLLAKNRADADYQWARRKFLDEARLLAQLSHPNIVNVCRVLEANNTVYMLLDFIPGGTLESWLQNIGGPPTQEELDLIAGPLLSALELVHHNGMCHLDVAPDNVLIRSSDGAPILLDFGAARLEIKQRSQLVSAMLFKSGYSAPEQYTSSANRYGPWTDIYAAGATLYRAIAGNRPIESTERSLKDRLPPARAIGNGRYRESFLRAIDAALRLPLEARPQTVAAWRAQLLDAGPSTTRAFSATTRILPPGLLDRLAAARSSAAARRVADISERSREHVLRAWHSLSPQQRRLGMGAGSALVLVALAAVSAGPLLRSGAAPQPSAPAIASGQVPRIETPAPALPPISRPLPSTRPGSIASLPVKLGALVSEPHKAWLGAKAGPVNQSMAKSFGLLSTNGVFLEDAGPESPIRQGGGRAGDIILSINGRDVATPADLRARIQALAPGDQATLEVWRFGAGTQSFKDMLLDLAAKGDGHAMNWLGMYSFGSTILPHDDKLALDWLAKGAEAGDVDAMFNLGNTLASGTRTKKDLAKAVGRLRDAALGGHQPAASRLSDVLAEQTDTSANATRQAGVLRKLADLGNGAAMRVLGRWYAVGYGLPKNKSEARRWYQRAAELGEADAFADVGWMYFQGDGVPEDNAEAVRYFRMAVAIGSLEALRHLAWHMDNGVGVDRRDPDAAAELYFQAFASGDLGALRFMSSSVPKMSSDCRAGIQRRLQEAGFYTGAVDGRSNDATLAALKTLHNSQPRVAANM
ncbi:MAG TPA: protein kinase [Hyphomicrobiaceae bacterium]